MCTARETRDAERRTHERAIRFQSDNQGNFQQSLFCQSSPYNFQAISCIDYFNLYLSVYITTCENGSSRSTSEPRAALRYIYVIMVKLVMMAIKSTKRIFSLRLTFLFPMFCHMCDEPEMIVSDQHKVCCVAVVVVYDHALFPSTGQIPVRHADGRTFETMKTEENGKQQ